MKIYNRSSKLISFEDVKYDPFEFSKVSPSGRRHQVIRRVEGIYLPMSN